MATATVDPTTSNSVIINTTTALPPSLPTPASASASPGKPLPPTSTFSFTSPLPPSINATNFGIGPSSLVTGLKQRRVSLALPSSSPRLATAWPFRDDTGLQAHGRLGEGSGLTPEKKGKMRRIDSGDSEDAASPAGAMRPPEKKTRKKWSMEETQMLVVGCNKACFHGVGNWKAMLKDPELRFDGRSAVDLKDRFRTYYPDAYKQHYPNAKTHLSSKVRSTLPDGTSIFEKTRSKKRRPFTEDEDRALKAGYEKHGTVWSTIVRDPVFREQNRRSTDLRDRFRNAFPELYQAAGYKPRTAAKKKQSSLGMLGMSATDDQVIGREGANREGAVGPMRRKRALTNESLFRGGTKSVPESVTNSDDELGESEDEELEDVKPSISFVDCQASRPRSASVVPPGVAPEQQDLSPPGQSASASSSQDVLGEIDMPLDDPFASFEDLIQASESLDSSAWSTPLHSMPWNTASPASSHISADYFAAQSPLHTNGNGDLRTGSSSGSHLIGKSAWGTQDWLSANPRLDHNPSGASSSGASSYAGGGISPEPASPLSSFSFHSLGAYDSSGVFDRYDLLPAGGGSAFAFAHDFASEVGAGDSHSTFSDPELSFAPASFRGFTHHSSYAGDLIFGARTHQPPGQQTSFFGLGLGLGGAGPAGAGLDGSAGVHPSQLHTPSLAGIDELELIHLNDDPPEPMELGLGMDMDRALDLDAGKEPEGEPPDAMAALAYGLGDAMEGVVAPSAGAQDSRTADEMHSTPPATPVRTSRAPRPMSTYGGGVASAGASAAAMQNRSFSVPPGEHRADAPFADSSYARPPLTPTRSLSLLTTLGQMHGATPPPPASTSQAYAQQQPPHGQFFSVTPDTARPPASDQAALSFLDLHYYGGSAAQASLDALVELLDGHAAGHTRQGQALDLARSSSAASLKPGGNSFGGRTPQLRPASVAPANGVGTVTPARLHTHHRGMSAVAPQDLVLNAGNDNKRKRMSWDGMSA
ncbi:hypothetical protein PUNSTDRAFT_106713 [Punctularia strigosozonata HHB-11173 SS5]|uniref:uncharacterized protein n=1 Tax=Punctularia strigosozonata (strain HHB-11173) TaxID=741275 RepID=UPI0004418451|nr:uncharacterized protein PUNSTDRAFT_106713 [Punctularia strigosozonata HHB-11173 SS5]EIN05731.1 hypothetical protein PUNSTDRAFT_106713 [Punctularia strigosozonata HHB-11173 SS5]